MCGIAGFLTEKLPAEVSTLKKMCDRIEHRGPDGAGYYVREGTALGHRRLSIIDLAGGGQPLANEDGNLQVIFNGEIYNFAELREDLERRGHQFRTHSDTEVLVHLYEEVGERLPEYLNGMFAFAIWDERNRTLFLARDRFGEKPLYYTAEIRGLRFAFASELKALTVLGDFRAQVNPASVAEFLALSYISDPETIYNGVYKLRAGHSIIVTLGGITMRRYWSPAFSQDQSPDLSELTERMQGLLEDAVRCRMVSDVPLGAFLSGGVDSSAVTAFMSRHASLPVKTFSIGFTNKAFDELPFARQVAMQYRTDHSEETVTPVISEVLQTLIEHFDEPFGDSSAIPMLYLARMTRRHVTVALSGDGADELFGGYRRYYYGVLEERLRSRFPQWFRQSVVRMGASYYPKFDYLPRVFRAKSLLTNLSESLSDSYYNSMSAFSDKDLTALLGPDLRDAMTPREKFRARFKPVSELSPLQQLQAVDLETYLPGDILVKVDRATMAHSLESRAPWLDHRLAELSFQMPSGMHIRGRDRKHFFKGCIQGLVPKTVLRRSKMGFSVPLAEWLRTSLRPIFQSHVINGDARRLFVQKELNRLWSEHQSGFRNHERKLWNILMLACWDSRYNNSGKKSFAVA
jgi:asparagine synthase (glutamine-hydrolysing)